MSTTADLMGLGMSPALANRLGNNPQSLSGNGTAQTTATAIGGATINLITPTSSNTAFVLSNTFSTGRPVYLFNLSSTQTALIFPPSGGTINGGAANASVSISPLNGGIFMLENGSGVAAETWGALLGISSLVNLSLTGNLTVAGEVYESVTNAITAGTTHSLVGATALTTQINNVTVVANASDAVALPAAVIGASITIFNGGTHVAAVWPQAADAIDGGATGASVALTNAKRATFYCVAANTWISAQLGVVSA